MVDENIVWERNDLKVYFSGLVDENLFRIVVKNTIILVDEIPKNARVSSRVVNDNLIVLVRTVIEKNFKVNYIVNKEVEHVIGRIRANLLILDENVTPDIKMTRVN